MEYGKTLAIDSAGDLVLNADSDMTTISGTDKIRQDIRVIISSVKRSFPFDAEFGIDYPHLIELNSLRAVEFAVTSALMKHPHITKVTRCVATRNLDRVTAVSTEMLLDTGEVITFEATL